MSFFNAYRNIELFVPRHFDTTKPLKFAAEMLAAISEVTEVASDLLFEVAYQNKAILISLENAETFRDYIRAEKEGISNSFFAGMEVAS